MNYYDTLIEVAEFVEVAQPPQSFLERVTRAERTAAMTRSFERVSTEAGDAFSSGRRAIAGAIRSTGARDE